MDINAVSRALHALNMNYQAYVHTLGMSQALSAVGGKYVFTSYIFKRKAIAQKCSALIAHDQMLNGDIRVR